MVGPEWIPGYKVIRRRDRWSAIMGLSGVRYYERGAIICPAPGCGPLCVFTDRAHAERFRHNMYAMHGMDLRIVRCAWVPSAHNKVWRDDHEKVVNILKLPPGTALASAVFCFE